MNSQPPALDSSIRFAKFIANSKAPRIRKNVSHSGMKQSRQTSTCIEIPFVDNIRRFDGIPFKIS
jgi:hypothetical protein